MSSAIKHIWTNTCLSFHTPPFTNICSLFLRFTSWCSDCRLQHSNSQQWFFLWETPAVKLLVTTAAIAPCSVKALHDISIPNDFRHPRHLHPWPSDHCILHTPLSCRAWDRGRQGWRLFNRLEMAACPRTPLPPPHPSSSRLVHTPLFGEEGAGLLSGTCPGEHPLPALRQTDFAWHVVNTKNVETR